MLIVRSRAHTCPTVQAGVCWCRSTNTIVGLADDLDLYLDNTDQPTPMCKKVTVYMARSVNAKWHTIVAWYPVVSEKACRLSTNFWGIIKFLADAALDVVAVVCDGAQGIHPNSHTFYPTCTWNPIICTYESVLVMTPPLQRTAAATRLSLTPQAQTAQQPSRRSTSVP